MIKAIMFTGQLMSAYSAIEAQVRDAATGPENYDNTTYHAGHKTVEHSKLYVGDEDV